MDEIIKQQAAHYGLTVEQFTELIDDVAAYQEYMEYYDE